MVKSFKSTSLTLKTKMMSSSLSIRLSEHCFRMYVCKKIQKTKKKTTSMLAVLVAINPPFLKKCKELWVVASSVPSNVPMPCVC